MKREFWPALWGVAGFVSVGLACLVAREMRGPRQVPAKLMDPSAITAVVAVPAAEPAPAAAPPLRAEAPAVPAAVVSADDSYYGQLRSSVRWMQTRMGSAPDYDSRVLLAKSAAHRARLHEVGLSWRDVYGIITAETSWVPRRGQSKDGTPNLGIAQFEPATARALGLRNPNDLVEAVHVAAVHMKEAALWSGDRIAGLPLGARERADKLREGVSIYYNLSSRGRAAWNGRNTDRLPIETRRHIANARVGAQEAAMLDAQQPAVRYAYGPGQMVATSLVPTAR
jgi:hypothetical protein